MGVKTIMISEAEVILRYYGYLPNTDGFYDDASISEALRNGPCNLALYRMYLDTGEMPYGTAKARTGDPDQWMFDQLCRALGEPWASRRP